jgi:two-component system chemotaxis response regulator CheY
MPSALVVDDSPMIRHMVRMALETVTGLAITEAATGLEAIEWLMVRGADLVVLDLNMPDMHGLDVLHFVRGRAAFSSLPIIVLTTRGDEQTRQSAMLAGANLFRTKPFRPESLASDARSLLAAPMLVPANPGEDT